MLNKEEIEESIMFQVKLKRVLDYLDDDIAQDLIYVINTILNNTSKEEKTAYQIMSENKMNEIQLKERNRILSTEQYLQDKIYNLQKENSKQQQYIEQLENKVKEQQAEIEEKDKEMHRLTTLEVKLRDEIEGLKKLLWFVLGGRTFKIDKRSFISFHNHIQIERMEDIKDESFIFRAR